MHNLTTAHKFELFDKAAKSSYLMYVFSLGIINQQSLFISGGYSDFYAYTADRFEIGGKQTNKYLTVFNRLKDYIIDKSLSTPDQLLPIIQHHPLADFPLQKLYIISQLSDTKLRNLIIKGEVTLGNNQKFTLDKLRKLGRDRLLELISEQKPAKLKKQNAEINLDDIQLCHIHSVELYTILKELQHKISSSKLSDDIIRLYNSTLKQPIEEFMAHLTIQLKPDLQ